MADMKYTHDFLPITKWMTRGHMCLESWHLSAWWHHLGWGIGAHLHCRVFVTHNAGSAALSRRLGGVTWAGESWLQCTVVTRIKGGDSKWIDVWLNEPDLMSWQFRRYWLEDQCNLLCIVWIGLYVRPYVTLVMDNLTQVVCFLFSLTSRDWMTFSQSHTHSLLWVVGGDDADGADCHGAVIKQSLCISVSIRNNDVRSTCVQFPCHQGPVMTILVAGRRLSLTQLPITDHLHWPHSPHHESPDQWPHIIDLETRGHGTHRTLSTPDTGDTGWDTWHANTS